MVAVLTLGLCLGTLLTLMALVPLLKPPKEPDNSARGVLLTLYAIAVSIILIACVIYVIQN